MNIQEQLNPNQSPARVNHETIIIDPKEYEGAEALYRACLDRNWSEADQLRLFDALDLTFHALHGDKRDSGDPASTHSLAVAMIELVELNGTPDEVIGSLVHDIPEDTKKRETNVVTISDIRSRFDEQIARWTEALTKVKSSANRDLPVQTHHKIYELIYEPPPIKIKLADRLHNMRTLEFIDREKQKLKAKETLDIYVPLALAGGYSGVAEELTYWSIYFLLDEAERSLLDPYKPHREKAREQIVDSEIQAYVNHVKDILETLEDDVFLEQPTLYDKYRAAGGDIQKLFDVSLPTGVRVIIQEDPGPKGELLINRTRRWQAKAAGFAQIMYGAGLLTDAQLSEFNRSIAKPGRRAESIVRIQNQAVSIGFVDSEYQPYNVATVDDYMNPHSPLHAYALDKIGRFQENFSRISDSRTKFQTSLEFSELLRGGVIVVEDEQGKRYGLPEGATGIDAAFAFKSRLGKYIERVDVWRDGVKQKNIQITDALQHGDKIIIIASKKLMIQPRWIDTVKTPFALQEIQKYYKKIIASEHRGQLPVEYSPVTQMMKKRGLEKLNMLFRQLSMEREGKARKLYVDLMYGSDVFARVPMRYPTAGKKLEQAYTNFFVSAGLGEITANGNRGSLLWSLTETLYSFQSSLVIIEIIIPNIRQTLQRVLGEIDMNIESLITGSDQQKPSYMVVHIGIAKAQYQMHRVHFEESFAQLMKEGIVDRVHLAG